MLPRSSDISSFGTARHSKKITLSWWAYRVAISYNEAKFWWGISMASEGAVQTTNEFNGKVAQTSLCEEDSQTYTISGCLAQ